MVFLNAEVQPEDIINAKPLAEGEGWQDPLDYGEANNIPSGHLALMADKIDEAGKNSELTVEDLLPLQAYEKRLI